MYKNVYCDIVSVKGDILSLGDVICRKAYKPKVLLRLFIDEARKCYYTALSFPSKIVNDKEKQVQKQNYDYFIQTMADMVRKYA